MLKCYVKTVIPEKLMLTSHAILNPALDFSLQFTKYPKTPNTFLACLHHWICILNIMGLMILNNTKKYDSSTTW